MPPNAPASEVIAVVSPGGESGKTTTAVNLAVALAAAGRTVLLVDLDPRGKAGDSLVQGHHQPGGSYRLLSETLVSRDWIAATEIPDLYLLPADPALAGIEDELAMEGDSRTRLIQGLASVATLTPRFDTVILDCPPALGLITVNILGAADRVLIPVPADPYALEGLPALLKAIQRLRTGLNRPLQGVHLLAVPGTEDSPDPKPWITQLRRDYPRLGLHSGIPRDEAVQEATTRNKPVLAHCLSCPASQAYLALAAEWLTLPQQGEREGPWRYQARQETMAQSRQGMEQRIRAWLVDPSSLLYDAQEASQLGEEEIQEALYHITRHPHPPSWLVRHRGQLFAGLLGLVIGLPFLIGPEGGEDWLGRLRLDLATWLISPGNYWQIGSLLLAQSDEAAYRELLLGAQLVEHNRLSLLDCRRRAYQQGGAVPCHITVGSSP